MFPDPEVKHWGDSLEAELPPKSQHQWNAPLRGYFGRVPLSMRLRLISVRFQPFSSHSDWQLKSNKGWDVKIIFERRESRVMNQGRTHRSMTSLHTTGLHISQFYRHAGAHEWPFLGKILIWYDAMRFSSDFFLLDYFK